MLRAALAGYQARIDKALSLSWHGAAFGRMVPLPPLSEILAGPVGPQREEDMLFNMQLLAAASTVAVEPELSGAQG